jgi:hypothetical protein
MNVLSSAVTLTLAIVAFLAFHVAAMLFVLAVAVTAPIVDALVWSGRASVDLLRRRVPAAA